MLASSDHKGRHVPCSEFVRNNIAERLWSQMIIKKCHLYPLLKAHHDAPRG